MKKPHSLKSLLLLNRVELMDAVMDLQGLVADDMFRHLLISNEVQGLAKTLKPFLKASSKKYPDMDKESSDKLLTHLAELKKKMKY